MKISVYLPTRNRVDTLSRAVASVLAQTRPPYELIVVNDGSTDQTSEWLAAMMESNQGPTLIRVISSPFQQGACASRNAAIASAEGDWITGIDDDDEWLPGRLETMCAAASESYSFVCASDVIRAENGRTFWRISPPQITLQSLLSRNVVGNQILVRKEVVTSCGGFDLNLPAAQDYDLWIRIVERYGPAVGVASPLQIVHSENVSRISTSRSRRHGYWLAYKKHKRLMDRSVRRSHLFGLMKANGRIGWRNASTMFVKGLRLRVVVTLVAQRLPRVGAFFDLLASIYLRFLAWVSDARN